MHDVRWVLHALSRCVSCVGACCGRVNEPSHVQRSGTTLLCIVSYNVSVCLLHTPDWLIFCTLQCVPAMYLSVVFCCVWVGRWLTEPAASALELHRRRCGAVRSSLRWRNSHIADRLAWSRAAGDCGGGTTPQQHKIAAPQASAFVALHVGTF